MTLARSHHRRGDGKKKPTLAERIDRLSIPEPMSGCFLWIGNVDSRGYGRINIRSRYVGAHRLAWSVVNGPIPPGMQIRHSCDNPPCVNPAHLLLGTNHDNVLDMARRGRHHCQKKTHCPAGHPYDETNTYTARSGSRMCKACGRARRITVAQSRRGAA